MKSIVAILLVFVFPFILQAQVNKKGKLLPDTLIIDIYYQGISCECAQWIEKKDIQVKNKEAVSIFLEPASKNLINADTLFDGKNIPVEILVTGRFYSGIGFPENYKPVKGNPDPAKVFRYKKIKIISK